MIVALVSIFLFFVVFKIVLKLNVKSSVYLLLSLLVSYSAFHIFSMTEKVSSRLVRTLLLILAMVVFGSNSIEDGWLIYIILCVIIGVVFHLFGF